MPSAEPASLTHAALDATGEPLALGQPGGATLHLTPAACEVFGLSDGSWPDLDELDRRAHLAGLGRERTELPGGFVLARYIQNGERAKVLHVALHDLRSPLANVRTYLGLLAAGKLAPERQASAFQVMIRNADKALSRITEFLESELVELEPVGLHLEHLDLTALVAQVVEKLRPELAERGVRLTLSTPGPAMLHGDPDRLRRAVEAVLARAGARSPSASAVDVQLAALPHKLMLRVSDAGGPLAPPDAELRRDARITLDKRLSPATELANARATFEALGGRFSLDATRTGATWTLELPLR
ncbi:MAG: HAMP domain-containing histidine kinase [Deltaproteobacteria bacterium]|nr:HAMP domain-containing histidine kinase [Deltaproteobacteria bacterium]